MSHFSCLTDVVHDVVIKMCFALCCMYLHAELAIIFR